MARRRRSRFSEMTTLNLGELPLVGDTVKGGDVFVGVIAGLIGQAVIKKFAPADLLAKIPAGIAPVVTSGGVAAALYFAQKKSQRGTGHAIGAASVGLAFAARDWLVANKPFGLDFSGMTTLNLGQYGGFLVDQPRMNGFLVDQTARPEQMSGLAQLSMMPDYDGLSDLGG